MSNYSQAIEKLTKQAGGDDMKCALAELLIDTMTDDRADAIVQSDKTIEDVITQMCSEAKKAAKGGRGAISPRRAIEIAAEVFGFTTDGTIISGPKSAAAPASAPKQDGSVHVDLFDLL